MSLSVHEASVGVYVARLQALSKYLAKGEAFAAQRKLDPAALLAARLYPDMFPLTRQVQIATDQAKGAASRLAGVDIPKYEDNEASFADLQARIEKTIAYLQSIPAEKFEGAETREITLPVGGKPRTFVGRDYLLGFAMAHFYFHVVTAFDILRHCGVEIGKRDFLGLA